MVLHKSLLLVAAVVLAAASTTSRNAEASIVDFTFESDTVGSIPAGWSETSGYDGHAVTAYVTDTTAGAGTKSFYMNDWASVSQLALITSFAPQSTGLYELTGMARVEQTNRSIAPFTALGYQNTRFNDLWFATDGTFHYANGHGTDVSTGVAYQSGEWYSFAFQINMDSDRWGFDIHNALGTDISSASNLKFGTSYTSYFYQIRSWGVGGGDTGAWYIDDVSLGRVPEPCTFAVWATGVVSVSFMGWRRRKRSW